MISVRRDHLIARLTNSVYDSCFLFSACKTKVPYNDCVIGIPQEDCLCSIGYLGTLDASNVADIVFDVRDEATCKRLCSEDKACKIYTYYNSSDPNEPKTCILLSNPDYKRLPPSVSIAKHLYYEYFRHQPVSSTQYNTFKVNITFQRDKGRQSRFQIIAMFFHPRDK